jgi:hypothetical protein
MREFESHSTSPSISDPTWSHSFLLSIMIFNSGIQLEPMLIEKLLIFLPYVDTRDENDET